MGYLSPHPSHSISLLTPLTLSLSSSLSLYLSPHPLTLSLSSPILLYLSPHPSLYLSLHPSHSNSLLTSLTLSLSSPSILLFLSQFADDSTITCSKTYISIIYRNNQCHHLCHGCKTPL